MATSCAGIGTCGAATLRSSRKAARKRRSPAAKPTRRPGRFERFDSEWNTTTLAKSRPDASSMPARRVLAVDLAVAFVGENQKP